MKNRAICIFLVLLIFIACLMLAYSNAGAAETTEGNTVEIIDRIDRVEDGTLNILMMGNSFCYYYVEELYDILMENLSEGITAVQIYNLCYSGCSLTRHFDWWSTNTGEYDLFKVDASGRNRLQPFEQWTLEAALNQADWNYISLQCTT